MLLLDRDGVGSARRSSRPGLITARLADGLSGFCTCQSRADRLKVYSEDGSSLPLDRQLCLAFHVSTFFPLLDLRCLGHGLP